MSLVLMGLLGGVSPVWAAATNSLTDVRYSVENGRSRVALTFDGDIRYSPVSADGVVRLGFSGTRVALPLRARRQLLSTGLVTAISVTAASNDSTVVAIMLRPSTTYRCTLPSSGSMLYVDVLPAGNRAGASPATVSVKPQTSAVKSAVQRPSSTSAKPQGREQRTVAVPARPQAAVERESLRPASGTVVDIPSIAREQTRSATDAPAQMIRPAVKRTESSMFSPEIAAALSALAVCLLTGTGALMVIAFRKKPAKPAPAPPAPSRPNAATGLREYLEPAGERSPFLIDEPDESDESEFVHETSLQLARSFKRGSEEITLARRLHDHAAPQWSGARMNETLSKATTPNQRLHFARKLGVGRGEMDLAVKLRTLKPADKREEVAS
jgi:hypothetical protein